MDFGPRVIPTVRLELDRMPAGSIAGRQGGMNRKSIFKMQRVTPNGEQSLKF